MCAVRPPFPLLQPDISCDSVAFPGLAHGGHSLPLAQAEGCAASDHVSLLIEILFHCRYSLLCCASLLFEKKDEEEENPRNLGVGFVYGLRPTLKALCLEGPPAPQRLMFLVGSVPAAEHALPNDFHPAADPRSFKCLFQSASVLLRGGCVSSCCQWTICDISD